MFSKLKKLDMAWIAKAVCAVLLTIGISIVTILSSGLMQAYRIVTVIDKGEETTFSTLKTNVDEMLLSQNIPVDALDELDVKDDGHNMLVIIDRAVNVSVTADGKKESVKVKPSSRVNDVLNEKAINLGAEDMVNIEQNQKVADEMDIVVQRISHTSRSEVQEVGYEKETQETSKLAVGQKQLKTAGQNGEIIKYYEDKVVDGVVVESVEVGSNMITEPVNEVVLIGTGKAPEKTVLTSKLGASKGAPQSYKKLLTGRGTAYSGGGRTATGQAAARGLVAVNPNKIPYGTKMYIVSQDGYVYGYAVAADCGGAMMNGSVLVDLYMETEAECNSFGSRAVNVYIL